MKRFFLGLATGLALCVGIYFIVEPQIKKTAYDSGFVAGNKMGLDMGLTTGEKQGIEKVLAAQKKEKDSVRQVEIAKAEAAKKAAAARKPVKREEVVQNWHVIGGRIDAPVVDTTK